MKQILSTLAISTSMLFAIITALPASAEEPRFDPTGATPITECPAPTNIGVYFIRGHNEDGSVICGLAYYDACPHLEGEAAGSLMCTKVSNNLTSAPAIPTSVLETTAVTVISKSAGSQCNE